MIAAVQCRKQVKILEHQLRIVPRDADRQYALGQAYLTLGRFREGWPLCEARFRSSAGGVSYQPALPAWRGDPKAGGVLYVQPEQGLGDQIMMSRYLPWLHECGQWAKIMCDVRPPLLRLFQHHYGDMIVSLSAKPLDYDWSIPMLSLPGVFCEWGYIPWIPPAPYLHLNPHPDDYRWHGMIGIAWAGARVHRDDARRSLPRAMIQEFVNQSDQFFQWCCMQIDQPTLGGTVSMVPLFQDMGKWDVWETARIIIQLKLVITCDSMLAHLAGALGVPCWVLLPYIPDWRWQFDRTDSPWYPSLKLYRQPRPGDWAAVLKNVRKDLEAL